MNKKYVVVSGFISTGSSAVVDYLKQFPSFYECGAEIRFVKDPFGLCDLENSLIDNWELINSAFYIKKFYKESKKWCRYGRLPFSPAGHSYKKTITKNYLKITKSYINNLTNFIYGADFYPFKFDKNYFKYVFDRNLCFLGKKTKIKLINKNKKAVPFLKMDKTIFLEKTRQYIDQIFEDIFKKNKKEFVLLDQAVSVNNVESINKYFTNGKLIVVDRDPRDSFIDCVMSLDFYFKDPTSKEAGYYYSEIFKAMHSKLLPGENILYINFEDLVLNYEETTDRICNFLNISKEDIAEEYRYFNPNISIRGIGKWKKYYDIYKDAIDEIEVRLKEFLK